MKQRSSLPTRMQTVPRVIFASPYVLGDFNRAHAAALSATRGVFKLERGHLGQAIDRILDSDIPLLHRLDLLRTLAQSETRQGAYWAEIWPRVNAHFQIELGTHLLLRPPPVNPAIAALVGGLIARSARMDVICDWSASLLDVLRDAVLPDGRGKHPFTAIDRSCLAEGGRGLWIGQSGLGSAEARRRGHTILCVKALFQEEDLAEANAYLDAFGPVPGRHGRQRTQRASGQTLRLV
ncbi:MAG: hypothetical protein WBG08_06670 [Litorimonas sp.]